MNVPKHKRLANLRKRYETEAGPGLYMACLQSKHGLDGGQGTITSVFNQIENNFGRLAKLNDIAIEEGLSPADETVAQLKLQYLDLLILPKGGPVWTTRNAVVNVYLKQPIGAALLWLDGDMEWNQPDVERLRQDLMDYPEYDMVGAVVSTRSKERLPCIYRWDEENMAFPRIDIDTCDTAKMIEVDGLGCAFTAVRRKLLDAFEPVHNGYYWQVYNLSEDLFFCAHARKQLEARIAVDPRITPRHVGYHGFYWKEPSDEAGTLYGQILERLDQYFSYENIEAAYPSIIKMHMEDTGDVPSVFGAPEYDAALMNIVQKHHQHTFEAIKREAPDGKRN